MSKDNALTFGVAGCGAMGLPMAEALFKNGFDVCGFDVRSVEEFGGFSDQMMVSAEAFSNACDVVICVVRDEKQVLDLCFDDQALYSATNPPKIFVLSSTVSPRFVHRLRDLLPYNVVLLDAPMSGAPLAAIAASLTFMVGGPADYYEMLKPAFSTMGEKINHLGDLGSGMSTKVLNNFVAATTVVAVRNVLKQADRLGMDREALLKIIHQSSGQTWFGSHFDQINWADEGYDPANTIGILEKDVKAFIDALEGGAEPLHEAVIEGLRGLSPAGK